MSGKRQGCSLKDDIIRIRVGKYICETMNAEGRYYRSAKTNKKWYCSSFTSWFQCRLQNIEPGNYPIKFETRNNGHSITSISGFSFNIDNKRSFLCKSFAEIDKKASIFNIFSVLNTNLLKVRGRFLNESNLQVKWGGKICTQTSVEFVNSLHEVLM